MKKILGILLFTIIFGALPMTILAGQHRSHARIHTHRRHHRHMRSKFRRHGPKRKGRRFDIEQRRKVQ